MLNPITELPPFSEDTGYSRRTPDVLVTDGKEWWIAYLERYDDSFPDAWKEKGRDGYDLNVKLIGWKPLSNLF